MRMSAIERVGRSAGLAAKRGTWMARGVWLLAVAEALTHARDHVMDRLSEKERARMVEIVKTSKGRPSNLDSRERRELQNLFSKIEPAELAKSVAKSSIAGRGRSKK